MCSVPKIRIAETVLALALLVLLTGVALVSTGCNDGGEADIYSQISAGSPGSSNSGGGGSSTPARDASQDTPAPAGLAGEEVPSLPGAEGEAAEGETAGQDDDLTLIKGIEIIEFDCKAPYPDFKGADRYDIKVILVTDDPIDAQVFRVLAIGEDGEVVGEQERDLRLPRKKPGTLLFNDWWCKSIPVTLEFHTTDTAATSAEGGETNNVQGRAGAEGNGGAGGNGGAATSGLN